MSRVRLWFFTFVLACGLCQASTFANTVHVRFNSKTPCEIALLNNSVPLFSNRTFLLASVPKEMQGLSFTRRVSHRGCDTTITADGDATVYLFVESDDGKTPNPAVKALADDGWIIVNSTQAFAAVKGRPLSAFKRSFTDKQEIKLSHGGASGYFVAATNLVLDGATESGSSPSGSSSSKTPDTNPSSVQRLQADPPQVNKPLPGPTTKVALMQTGIRTMAFQEQSSGLMLGITSDVVLTVLRGDSPTMVNFRFITPVGPQMLGSKDDAMRFIHVQYPNWLASGAELTFEDRDSPKDGGSIGAALTTLVLSAIRGFPIDRSVAVTGDISADGRLQPVGGIYAKVRGAEGSACTIVVLPADNFDQLVNTETFIGKGEVPHLQIIGAATIDDVIAIVRPDRDAKLTLAMKLYGEVAHGIGQSKTYLRSRECTEKLNLILTLAPRHFSAKLQLMNATDKRPKTLSEGASLYYVSVAVNQIMPMLVARAKEQKQMPPSNVVHQGLDDLDKLRPMCDAKVVPLIEAWQRFIRTVSSVESGLASPANLDTQYQAIIDALAELNMNADSMQKRLKEGI
jgi:hypothetical protein